MSKTRFVSGFTATWMVVCWAMASALAAAVHAGIPAPAAGAGGPAEKAADSGRFNVLFIVVDDLRPELGCYGNKLVKSPNLDRLASSSMIFTRAYCQQALCAPSRASVLTGYRPESSGIDNNRVKVRDVMPDVLTLPQHFKNHGYHTISIGKVYHGFQDKPAWSERIEIPVNYYAGEEILAYQKRRRAEARAKGITDPFQLYRYSVGPPVESEDVPDSAYADGRIAAAAVEQLKEHRQDRFFLAVGFIKPHLPFAAPKRYWDLYERSRIPMPDTTVPAGAPAIALRFGRGAVWNYLGVPHVKVLDEAWTRKLIHGYYASVSYVDAQIGRVLRALDDLGLADRTVVVLWGDHGFKLGEYGQWGKQGLFEYDLRAPLLLRVPGRTSGRESRALVELVDVYPTLAELCGLGVPKHCEGTSMVPLLADPSRPWKKAAFSQCRRGENTMGYSVRTQRWRYNEWVDRRTQERIATELYDQSHGPFVRANLAADPRHRKTAEELSRMLKAGWRAAEPD